MNNFKFPKSEKLRLKKDLEQLFTRGSSSFKHPIVVRHLRVEGEGTNLCAVSVPKKKFKKAVDRNRLKRQMREAYRLNKHVLECKQHHFHLMFVYSAIQKEEYQSIEKAIQKLLKRLNQ